MSRPLRSSIISPSWPSNMLALMLMTAAIPPITAKAAMRLPLTPSWMRKGRDGNFPTPDGKAMLSPRPLNPHDIHGPSIASYG
jgi:hypothetical protein